MIGDNMEKKKKNFNGMMSRVDIQVTILVFVFTLFATLVTSVIFWMFTFRVIIVSLEERVYAIYESVETTLDMDTFTLISTEEDMDTDLYIEEKEKLLLLKNAAGVLYLYTAKENEEGDFIYVIDGLEEDQDFRVPGDMIEEEIQADMHLALSGVEVIPDEIVRADWGDIFVAYMPVHDESGEILGVVGIEFDAGVLYTTYMNLVKIIPWIIILLSVVASFISVSIFKRISNPFYVDMATKDSPTGLKNRNAYEVDMNNMIVRGQQQGAGIIMIDINGLKKVNDRLGHNAGDDYIKLVADCIQECKENHMVAYRIGGDEFVILVPDATKITLEYFIEKCSNKVMNQKQYKDMRCSVSCGSGIFDETLDRDFEDTYHRADEMMYQEKRRQKENRER